MSEHDPRTGPTVAATLSQLRSECETCGAWSPFTGRTEQRDGLTYAILSCPNRCAEFSVWSSDREPLVAAYEQARATVSDPEAYQRAFATLTGGDGAAIGALLASPPPELPLFSVEDVAVPRDAATRWCEMVLDWHGWRPVPERSVRIEEALAAAVRLDAPACVDAATSRIEPAILSAVVDRLTRRFYGRHTSVLESLRRGRTGG